MLTIIVVALVLYGPLYWVIRAAVRDSIRAARTDEPGRLDKQETPPR